MNYFIHVNATVSDGAGFEVGVDISVKGGKNLAEVGAALQRAVEDVSPDKKCAE